MAELENLKPSKLLNIINSIKSSTFSQFIKKMYSKDVNFTVSENNSQINPNFMFDLTQKKSMIYNMALILLVAKDSVSNLEIKNSLHNVFVGQGFDLRQTEVSTAMDELFNEGKFTRENASTAGHHFMYSLVAQPAVNTAPVVTAPSLTAPVSTPVPDAGKVVSLTNSNTLKNLKVPTNLNIQAIVDAGGGRVVLGNIGDQSSDFLKKIKDDVRVVFDAKDAGEFDKYLLTDATDMYEARNLLKFAKQVKHNDCRSITLKAYLKRAGIV